MNAALTEGGEFEAAYRDAASSQRLIVFDVKTGRGVEVDVGALLDGVPLELCCSLRPTAGQGQGGAGDWAAGPVILASPQSVRARVDTDYPYPDIWGGDLSAFPDPS